MKIDELEKIQNSDGSFGTFHSMSSNSSMTTEKALRRFFFLGLTKDVYIVERCLDYVRKCLYKKLIIPDRREKVINWDVFEELMFSAWLNLFQVEDKLVKSVQLTWKRVIENSIINGEFVVSEYKHQYRLIFGPKGLREISPANFYMVCILKDVLENDASRAYFNFIMRKGIYYIYDKNLYELPAVFDSKDTISYLIAIKLISSFSREKSNLEFIEEWIVENRDNDGNYYMENIKADGVVFPLSNNWRKKDAKISDINKFMEDVLVTIMNK